MIAFINVIYVHYQTQSFVDEFRFKKDKYCVCVCEWVGARVHRIFLNSNNILLHMLHVLPCFNLTILDFL